MRPMRWVKGVVVWAMVLAAGAAGAEDRPLQIERESTVYTVQADGSHVESREIATTVLKDTALSYAKDTSIGYSSSVQQAEIVEAYTRKPDGRRIDVPPGNFQVNTRAGQEGDSPIYSDRTTLTVVFPELAVGDTTVLSYRLSTHTPMFEGQFSVIRSYNPATYYGDVRVVVDAPESMAARHAGWQMHQASRRENGRSIVEWSWSNREPVDRESMRDSTYNVERLPGYAFSTFADYAQISQAYGAPAERKAAVTPRIQVLAEELAGDEDDEREIARRLYDWVARSITYAGNCIGLGAVVPRDLDVVLDNRMGDCKDQATLLQALLKGKGIDSTQALVNSGDVYALPEIPVASMVNHVMNYIPGLDLYLDPTAGTVPFGSLPQSVAGKRVLLVDGYRDDSMTPAIETGRDWQKMRTTLRIAEDGSVSGTQQLELGGRLALAARENFRTMSRNDAARLVKQYFQQGGLIAEGSLHYDEAESMLERFEFSADFAVERMLAVPGGVQIQPWFISFAPVAGIVVRNQSHGNEPAGESSCGSIVSEEEYVFEFPDGVLIAAIPEDFSVSGGNVRYEASYRQQGQRIVARRALDDRTPGPVCSAEYNTEQSRVLNTILPDIRSQIVYLRSSPES